MGPRSRRTLLGVLAWAGAVALTGTVAWNAVAVISDDGARTGVLAPAQVTAALAEARASASAAAPDAGGDPTPTVTTDPSAGAPPAPAPSSPPADQPGAPPSPTPAPPAPPQPSPTQATWVVTGGSVTVQCTGATIRLLAATPDDGWTVEVGSPGPELVEVELHRSQDESRVRAACSGGVPVQVTDDERSGHDSGHGSDHD